MFYHIFYTSMFLSSSSVLDLRLSLTDSLCSADETSGEVVSRGFEFLCGSRRSCRDSETQRLRDSERLRETQRDSETQRLRDSETQRDSERLRETQRLRDSETQRLRDSPAPLCSCYRRNPVVLLRSRFRSMGYGSRPPAPALARSRGDAPFICSCSGMISSQSPGC